MIVGPKALDLADALVLLGALLIVAGVAWMHLAAGLIVAGVAVLLFGVVIVKGNHGRPD